MPCISVLMSVHNEERYVNEAVESILRQTFTDFEFLICDDGSTDQTWEKLTAFSSQDRRIKLWRNERNLGLAKSINHLTREAEGEYIARMDGDDISLPFRFAHQIKHLEKTGLDVLGGWVILFGGEREKIQRFPGDHDEIKAGLLFAPMFMHPSVILRSYLLRENPYDPAAGTSEDYDLWIRLAIKAKMGNLRYPLLKYRRHPNQVSYSRSPKQVEISANIPVRYLDLLGINATERQKYIHSQFRRPEAAKNIEEVLDTEEWLGILVRYFNGKRNAQRIIAYHWYLYGLRTTHLGIKAWRTFIKSDLLRLTNIKRWQKLALLVLCAGRIRYNSKIYRRLLSLSPAGGTSGIG